MILCLGRGEFDHIDAESPTSRGSGHDDNVTLSSTSAGQFGCYCGITPDDKNGLVVPSDVAPETVSWTSRDDVRFVAVRATPLEEEGFVDRPAVCMESSRSGAPDSDGSLLPSDMLDMPPSDASG